MAETPGLRPVKMTQLTLTIMAATILQRGYMCNEDKLPN